MLKLSPRMQVIFELLIPGEPVWDFCCDHGYLGLNAYQSGRFSEIFFVDQVPHIVNQLRERFLQEVFSKDCPTKVHFIAQPGEMIQDSLYGTVIIAGVGAHTIFKIIESLHSKEILQARRLILGPQKDEKKLLEMLQQLRHFSFKISDEHYKVIERGRPRKLLIFEKI